MPVIPIGFAQVTHVFSGAALPFGAVVTYGVREDASHSPIEIATQCHDIFEANLLPRIASDINLVETRAKEGPNNLGPAAVYTETDSGGQAGPTLPANCCWLVEKHTGIGGRQGRGRMFIPGVPEADAGSDGAIAAGEVTSWNTALDTFLQQLSATALSMVLLHASEISPTTVSSLTLDGHLATQRQRMRR